MKKKPNMARNIRNRAAEPVAMPRWRNSRGSSMAARLRSSQATKAATSTMPATMAVTVSVSVQPRSGPSMMASTRAPMPKAARTAPSGSRRTSSVARVLGTRKITANRATTAEGSR